MWSNDFRRDLGAQGQDDPRRGRRSGAALSGSRARLLASGVSARPAVSLCRRGVPDGRLERSRDGPAVSALPGRDARRPLRLAAPPRRDAGRRRLGDGDPGVLRAPVLGVHDRAGGGAALARPASLRHGARRRAGGRSGSAPADGARLGSHHRDEERGALLRRRGLRDRAALRREAPLQGGVRGAADGPPRPRPAPRLAGPAAAARLRLRCRAPRRGSGRRWRPRRRLPGWIGWAQLLPPRRPCSFSGRRAPEGGWLLALCGAGLAAYLLLPAFAVRGPDWLVRTALPRTAAGLAPLAAGAIAIRWRPVER